MTEKAESEQKLSDAERQITDGETQISQAKETLVSGKSQMEDARAKIRAKQQELDEAKKTYQNGLQQLEQGKKQYEQGKAAYDSRYAEAQAQIQTGEQGLAVYRTELDQGWDGYQTLLKKHRSIKKHRVSGRDRTGSRAVAENPGAGSTGTGNKADTGCERTGLPDKEERTGHSKTAAYEWESRAGSGKSAAECK